MALPEGLPEPSDDGASDHLPGMRLPPVALPATDGSQVDLASLAGRSVVYAYPRTGPPGQPELLPDWDLIPGARGCTEEACGFRDHHGELMDLGVRVFGLSTQTTAEQRELVERVHLPFSILSDAALELTSAVQLPTFEAAGYTLLKRHTLVIAEGTIEHVFYPVFPPDTHAEAVRGWLRAQQWRLRPVGEDEGKGVPT